MRSVVGGIIRYYVVEYLGRTSYRQEDAALTRSSAASRGGVVADHIALNDGRSSVDRNTHATAPYIFDNSVVADGRRCASDPNTFSIVAVESLSVANGKPVEHGSQTFP